MGRAALVPCGLSLTQIPGEPHIPTLGRPGVGQVSGAEKGCPAPRQEGRGAPPAHVASALLQPLPGTASLQPAARAGRVQPGAAEPLSTGQVQAGAAIPTCRWHWRVCRHARELPG